MSKQTVGNVSIYVLNNNYQYEQSAQETNSKWLDTGNVMAVKRDKTIYAIRARNNFNFSTDVMNSEWFANTVAEYTNSSPYGTVSSNLFRGFGTVLSGDVENILLSNPVNVYGNTTSGNITYNQLGLGGSLVGMNFNYAMNLAGNINVQSNVQLFRNVANINMGSALPSALKFQPNVLASGYGWSSVAAGTAGAGNVNANTAYLQLQYNNSSINQWNRLINANLAGNVVVTASTDPTDQRGNAIPLVAGGINNAFTNEAYRHQFQLASNTSAPRQALNPAYMLRVSRFGAEGMTDVAGNFGSNASVFGFSGNFFANKGADNVLYANGNLITTITIQGNIVNPTLQTFNTNIATGILNQPLASGNLNGNLVNSSVYVTVTKNTGATTFDYISSGTGGIVEAGGNLQENVNFADCDRITLVQGNINLTKGYYLYNRITPQVADASFINASTVFSGDLNMNSANGNLAYPVGGLTAQPNLYYANANLRSSALVQEKDAKFLIFQGNSIIANNWQTTSNLIPVSTAVPNVYDNPNNAVVATGNSVCLYVRQGTMSVDNYTYVNTKAVSGTYIHTVPNFVASVAEPAGKVTLVDGNLCASGNIADLSTYQLPISVTINSNTTTLSANITPDFSFAIYGNVSEENRLNVNANVVTTNPNSFMGNLWSFDNLGARQNSKSTQFYPKIVYSNLAVGSTVTFGASATSTGGSVRALSLNQTEFVQNNAEYTISYPKFVGNTNASATLTNSNFAFYPNVTADGTVANVNLSSTNGAEPMNNLSGLNDLLLNDIAYSEYNFSSLSSKFTDLGNVCGLNNSNYLYSAVLPRMGNANLSSNVSLNANTDAFLNVLVDYNNFANLAGSSTDVHRLTIYDTQYRYFINSVARFGSPDLTNEITVEGSNNIVSNLAVNNGIYNSATKGNLAAADFALFTYESVNNDTTPVSAYYPFYSVKDVAGRTAGNVLGDVNYLFPGFTYKPAGSGFSFYDYKGDADADFVIENNNTIDKAVSITISGIDTINGIVKASINNPSAPSTSGATKSIELRPIRYSKSANQAEADWYSYFICKVYGETQSYVAVLFKLNSTGTNLSPDYASNLPATVNITAIQKDGSANQIRYKSALRVYNSAGVLQSTYATPLNVHTSPLSLYSFSSASSSADVNVGVNIYSIPSNSMVINYAYTQAVITKLLSYSRMDYAISGMSGYNNVNTVGLAFANSRVNNTGSAVTDGLLAQIPANATRYYFDQVHIDISNNILNPASLGVFRVDRSVEWVISRKINGSTAIVGRGLMTRTGLPNASSFPVVDYYLTENNMSVDGSGFYMRVNSNIIDLAARLYWQSISQQSDVYNLRQFVLNSKFDKLVARLFYVNPLYTALVSNGLNTTIGNFDLANTGALNMGQFWGDGTAGSLPLVTLSAKRGYAYDANASTSSAVIGTALFRVNIRPDSYALIHMLNGSSPSSVATYLNNPGQVVFSTATGVSSTAGFHLEFNQQSIDYQYASVTSPVLSNTAFVSIACYKHLGYGTVRIYKKDFTSNYNNDLPSSVYSSSANLTAFASAQPTVNAYKVNSSMSTVGLERPILYDGTLASGAGKFYINLNEFAGDDKFYFVGTGVNSQPYALNGKFTLVLYSGLYPLVINSLLMKSTANLNTIRTETAVFTKDLFNSVVPSVATNGVTQTNISEQQYYIALTNSTATGTINVRGYSYAPSATYWASGFWLGVYTNASSLLRDLSVVVQNSNGMQVVQPVNINYISSLADANMSDETLIAKGDLRTNYNCGDLTTFEATDKNGTDGHLFYINIKGNLNNYTGFQARINPARVRVYEALDINNNGEIDTESATNIRNIAGVSNTFALDNAFSELLFDLSIVPGKSYNHPKVVQDWVLARGVSNNIIGSQMDIQFNNLFSLGYNLDTFFVVKHHDVAQFDVITIATEAKTKANGTSLNALVVRDTAPLMIGQVNDWARTLKTNDGASALALSAGNFGAYSGLTFKLRQNSNAVNIVAGEIVKLFVDNTIADNTDEWYVSCSTAQSNRSYKIYSYDQERYAALLDEQLRIANQFV